MEPGWLAIPNLNGRVPAQEPPRDRPIIVRNLSNRDPGTAARRVTEHLAFFDPEAGHFVRIADDLFREPLFVFFHVWRDIQP